MIKNSMLVFAFISVIALGSQTVSAQFNIPSQVLDTIKDKRAPSKPAAPSTGESQRPQSQPAAQGSMTAGQAERYQSFKNGVNGSARMLEAIDSGKTDNMHERVRPFSRCIESYDAMIKEGIPPTYSVRRESWDPPLWTGTVEELRQKWCDSGLQKAQPLIAQAGLENNQYYKGFKTWVGVAVGAQAALDAGKSDNMDYRVKDFRNCVDMYEKMIKEGIPPTYSVRRDKYDPPHWTGTVEELRQKWCDPGLQKTKALAAAQDAPFRKALKNDKLSMALDLRSVFLPGRVETENPQQMAAAPVWFLHLIADNRCADGRNVNTVRRHQFDSQHTLVKTTEQQFCGSPPSSAYR